MSRSLQKIVQRTKATMFNKFKGEFMGTFEASFSLHNFRPGQEKVLQDYNTSLKVWLGEILWPT